MDQSAAILKREWNSRVKANPRYSLRAFAKNLGISHTHLSLFFSGERRLSKAKSKEIATKLCLNPEEEAVFLGSSDFSSLSLDEFDLISEWYHIAILSLMKLKDFKSDPAWIAKRLGIQPNEARFALERLERLGLIKKLEDKYVRVAKDLRFNNKKSTAATKLHHKQLLQKAANALDSVTAEERDFSAITIPIRRQDVPFVREKVQKFRYQLSEEVKQLSDNPDDLYLVSIQVFPLTERR